MPYEMLTSQLTCLRLPNRGLVGWSLSVGPLLVAAFSVVSPRPVPTLGLVENDGFVLDVLANALGSYEWLYTCGRLGFRYVAC